ncbi:RIP metalloprotease [Pseudactinotalea sp. HY158]|uniref:M50 family metallopeptidase n=1 Tax=Pseudactinotalea sp. HY158 TaxID=2654547 RepID=UPI00129CC348|nr:zinc metalloprotease [Pseudactinotalea sp. HY158]
MFWFGVLVIAVGLVISIALHEIGHLLPAKRFGVKVPQYFVGFGPTLWSTRRGETEYGVKAVPLGGFVRMIGMFPPNGRQGEPRRGLRGWMDRVSEDARSYSAQEVDPGDEHRTFYSLSTPKKLAVMFGGPVMNLVIAAVLFTIVVAGLGTAVATNRVSAVSPCVSTTGECTAEDPASPAAAAGLEDGDRIVAWNGESIDDWADLVAAISAGGADPAEVRVERDGGEFTTTITPEMTTRPAADGSGSETTPIVGITGTFALQPQPLTEVPGVVWQVTAGTAEIVVQLPQRLYGIATALFTDAPRDPGVMGLIGAGRIAGEIASVSVDQYGAKERAADLLSLLASLNIALFVFNMIPLLPLDGGHIAGALFEGTRRRWAAWRSRPDPGLVDTARLMPLTYAVFTVLLGMTVLLAVADIVKPVTL